ncbi:hypothetical protein ACWOAH_09425 [Vagococcus vulneris]|uniref:ESAT-6 secretion machinery protein EssA n=1 Tax=Vagococcus vulneris TaxID=1977869 RepID=A0A429ZUE0_9ENTE|nr:hypothetical protein [Vagococcus vulneris]RST97351.1 hypothetical protein CBF37_09725 [Vagococcus vulneris]
MKKIWSLALLALITFGFSTMVSANNPLTTNEKAILKELESVTSADGTIYKIPTDKLTQVENTLKANTYTDKQTAEVLDLVKASKKLVHNTSKGIKGKGGNIIDFGKQLPETTKKEIRANFTKAASILELKVDPKTLSLVTKNDKTATNGPVVKATGGNYLKSFGAVSSLFIGALVLGFSTKKYWLA